ncbi:MAG: hypothetical protein H7831_06800 [Magnetococcus sp. WYHC-3]
MTSKKKKEVIKDVITEVPKVEAPAGYVLGTNIPRDPRKNKVAIVGFAPSSMADVKLIWDDPTLEVWGLNQLYMAFPMMQQRATRWFQIHHRHTYDINFGRDHSHHKWMAEQREFPIYMQKQEPDIPASVAYPKDELLKVFYRRYFTNSISWMLATAIYETLKAPPGMGFKDIYMFGVDMAQDCVAPDTKILTADLRWLPAEDIKVGDKVLAFDENAGGCDDAKCAYRMWKSAEVQEANRLTRPSYRIYFEDGSTVVASAGHQWLTYAENVARWKRTDELITSAHRRPTKIIKPFEVWEENKSWEAGYLAAAFDGEGWIGQTEHRNAYAVNIGFSQKKNAMLNMVDNILEELGFDSGRGSGDIVETRNVLGGRHELLRFLGTIRPKRLLERFDPNKLGVFHRKKEVAVKRIEFLGDQEVIGFKTSTKTFFADGFASHNSEYAFERPSVEYFCGWIDALEAFGHGTKLYISEKSDICKTVFIYPFEDTAPIKAKFVQRRKELRDRVNQAAMGEQQAHDERLQLIGALDNMNYLERSWFDATRAHEGILPEGVKKNGSGNE